MPPRSATASAKKKAKLSEIKDETKQENNVESMEESTKVTETNSEPKKNSEENINADSAQNEKEDNDSEDEDGDEEEKEEAEGEDEEEGDEEKDGDAVENSENKKKGREYEVFVGALDKDATEEDLKKVFSQIGEVEKVTLAKPKFKRGKNPIKKNRGFAFVRFATVELAKKAAAELKNPEIRGKPCVVSATQENRGLHLANISKTWDKEKLKERLTEYGVKNMEEITLEDDSGNPGQHSGQAVLQFSTHQDARDAYRRLLKPDAVFGCDHSALVGFTRTQSESQTPESQNNRRLRGGHAVGSGKSPSNKKDSGKSPFNKKGKDSGKPPSNRKDGSSKKEGFKGSRKGDSKSNAKGRSNFPKKSSFRNPPPSNRFYETHLDRVHGYLNASGNPHASQSARSGTKRPYSMRDGATQYSEPTVLVPRGGIEIDPYVGMRSAYAGRAAYSGTTVYDRISETTLSGYRGREFLAEQPYGHYESSVGRAYYPDLTNRALSTRTVAGDPLYPSSYATVPGSTGYFPPSRY